MANPVKETAIGEVLVRSGIIDAAGLARAREVQEKKGTSLSQALVTMGLANENEVVAAIAKSMRLEALGSELPVIETEVAALLPSHFFRNRAVLPLAVPRKARRLGRAPSTGSSTVQEVESATGKL